MQKKILAVALSGMLVFGAGMSVYAADTAESEVAVSSATEEAGEELGSLLGGLLDSLGSEAENLDGLLSSVAGEGSDGSALLGSVLSGLSGEGGELELKGLVDSFLGGNAGNETEAEGGGFPLDNNTLKAIAGVLGIKLADEDLTSLSALLNEPDAWAELIPGFFGQDGIGTTILDMIGSKDNALGAVVNSMKNEDGGYDVDRLMNSLKEAEEKNGSLVINGTEVPEEELADAATEVMEVLGLIGTDESEAA